MTTRAPPAAPASTHSSRRPSASSGARAGRPRSSSDACARRGSRPSGGSGSRRPDDEEWRYTNVAPIARRRPSCPLPRSISARERAEERGHAPRPRRAPRTDRLLGPEEDADRLRQWALRAECSSADGLPDGVRLRAPFLRRSRSEPHLLERAPRPVRPPRRPPLRRPQHGSPSGRRPPPRPARRRRRDSPLRLLGDDRLSRRPPSPPRRGRSRSSTRGRRPASSRPSSEPGAPPS